MPRGMMNLAKKDNARDLGMERAAAKLQIAQGKGSYDEAALIVICVQEVQIHSRLTAANG